MLFILIESKSKAAGTYLENPGSWMRILTDLTSNDDTQQHFASAPVDLAARGTIAGRLLPREIGQIIDRTRT